MTAAVYLRVSGVRQDEANQEPECLQLCAARGLGTPSERGESIYQERIRSDCPQKKTGNSWPSDKPPKPK